MRWLAVVWLAACVDSSAGEAGVWGSPTDVATAPGTYAGYRVVSPCPEGRRDVGVIGMGAFAADTQEEVTRVGDDLLELLGDLPSVWGGGGYSLGCEAGVGTTVYMDDWRDVD